MAGNPKTYKFEPDYAVAPGATLQETIDSLGMTQRDLALRTGMAPKTINEIIKGKAPILPDTSVLLERVTGVPARMWNNLEANFREQLARITDRERLKADLAWLKTIPAKELIRRKVIEASDDKLTLLYAVLQFFGVGNVQQWRKLWMQPDGAFRRSAKFTAEPGAVATWLRLGEIESHAIDTQAYTKERFQAALDKIRALTIEPPNIFTPRMVDLAASAGVAVVFVPEVKKCPVSGVARWLAPEKALIQLSLRYKTDDHFWFSFFHETGHILHDSKKQVFIDDGCYESDPREARANRFAADFLIPPAHQMELRTLKTQGAIEGFAKDLRIAPGIVVGRLQKVGNLPWASPLNSLKRRFEWQQ